MIFLDLLDRTALWYSQRPPSGKTQPSQFPFVPVDKCPDTSLHSSSLSTEGTWIRFVLLAA
jgi:hypothetical protein